MGIPTHGLYCPCTGVLVTRRKHWALSLLRLWNPEDGIREQRRPPVPAPGARGAQGLLLGTRDGPLPGLTVTRAPPGLAVLSPRQMLASERAWQERPGEPGSRTLWGCPAGGAAAPARPHTCGGLSGDRTLRAPLPPVTASGSRALTLGVTLPKRRTGRRTEQVAPCARCAQKQVTGATWTAPSPGRREALSLEPAPPTGSLAPRPLPRPCLSFPARPIWGPHRAPTQCLQSQGHIRAMSLPPLPGCRRPGGRLAALAGGGRQPRTRAASEACPWAARWVWPCRLVRIGSRTDAQPVPAGRSETPQLAPRPGLPELAARRGGAGRRNRQSGGHTRRHRAPGDSGRVPATRSVARGADLEIDQVEHG